MLSKEDGVLTTESRFVQREVSLTYIILLVKRSLTVTYHRSNPSTSVYVYVFIILSSCGLDVV